MLLKITPRRLLASTLMSAALVPAALSVQAASDTDLPFCLAGGAARLYLIAKDNNNPLDAVQAPDSGKAVRIYEYWVSSNGSLYLQSSNAAVASYQPVYSTSPYTYRLEKVSFGRVISAAAGQSIAGTVALSQGYIERNRQTEQWTIKYAATVYAGQTNYVNDWTLTPVDCPLPGAALVK